MKILVNDKIIDCTPDEESKILEERANAIEEQINDAEAYSKKRKAEYPSVDELIVALWEGVVEERMAAVTKLEAKRQAVKLKYPK